MASTFFFVRGGPGPGSGGPEGALTGEAGACGVEGGCDAALLLPLLLPLQAGGEGAAHGVRQPLALGHGGTSGPRARGTWALMPGLHTGAKQGRASEVERAGDACTWGCTHAPSTACYTCAREGTPTLCTHACTPMTRATASTRTPLSERPHKYTFANVHTCARTLHIHAYTRNMPCTRYAALHTFCKGTHVHT